jgi:hypothetical protein
VKKTDLMAISKNHRKVVNLAAYRKERFTYDFDPEPEFLFPGDIEKLIMQGRYWGTYTQMAPYGQTDEGQEDNT